MVEQASLKAQDSIDHRAGESPQDVAGDLDAYYAPEPDVPFAEWEWADARLAVWTALTRHRPRWYRWPTRMPSR